MEDLFVTFRIIITHTDLLRVAFEHQLVRVRQDMSDDVTASYVFPSLNDSLGMAYPANRPRSSLSNDTKSCDNWVYVGVSIF